MNDEDYEKYDEMTSDSRFWLVWIASSWLFGNLLIFLFDPDHVVLNVIIYMFCATILLSIIKSQYFVAIDRDSQ